MMVPFPTPLGPQMTSEAVDSLLRYFGSILRPLLTPTKCKRNILLHMDGVVPPKSEMTVHVPHEIAIIEKKRKHQRQSALSFASLVNRELLCYLARERERRAY